MADPRLQWRQLAAPDLRGTSAILANANKSFDSAFDTAQGVLDRYDTGQKEKADNELLTEIASIDNEEKLGAFLGSGALEGRNISDGMRDRVLDLRDTVLGYDSTRASTDGTRANTAGTRARTAIAQAAEGRTAANYADAQRTRDALRGVAGAASGAAATGRQYGRGDPGADTRLMLARTLQAEAGNQGFQGMLDVGSVIRNRAASGKFGDGSVEGVIMQPGQFSAWNSVTGYAGGEQGQNMDFEPSKEAMDAADAILRGDYQDRTGGAVNYYAVIPGVSGVPSWSNDSFRQIDGDHFFGSATGQTYQGNTGAYNGYGATASAPDQIAAVRQSLVASGQFTPAEIEAQLAPLRAAAAQGDARLAGETGDAALRDLLLSPEVTTQQGLQTGALNVEGLTPGQQIDLATRAGGLAQAVPGVLAPQTTADPTVQGAIEEALAQNHAELGALPQTRLVEELTDFREDPTGTLISQIGDGLEGLDRNAVRTQVNSLADKMGVTPEIAALALRETYQADPSGFNTWGNVLSSGRAEEFIRSNLSNEALTRFRGSRSSRDRENAELKAAEIQLDALRTQAAKYPTGEVPAGLQRQIDSLRSTITSGQTPEAGQRQLRTYLQNSGAANRLLGLQPGSEEHTRVIRQIEADIKGDPSLTDRQKTLLINSIRG